VLAHESGVADVVDPLGGSFALERLTAEIEGEAEAYIRKIDEMGGAVAAIPFMQHEIQEAAYRYQRELEEGRRIVVGVNEFAGERAADEEPTPLFQLDPGLAETLAERVARFRAGRDAGAAARALEALGRGARGGDNLMALIVDAVAASATLGEICDRLREVFGVHRPSVTF
jgi:methylmalonyl-CoA mutase N-terminal domain/subunit